MSNCKIKICGLHRTEDIAYVNAARPDLAGFIINFPKSHRNVSPEEVRTLVKQLDPQIHAVGVFVDEDPAVITGLLTDGTLYAAQLHGHESEDDIRRLQKETGCPVIKAFKIRTREDIEKALQSPADYILLDQGYGGGQCFDWTLVPQIERPWFLAGGLELSNLQDAVQTLHPYGVDLSSSVEIDRKKDAELIRQTVELVRKL